MAPRTRSKALATTNQQATAEQLEGEFVAVNWLFLNKSNSVNSPRRIKITRSLFDDASQECRSLFAAKLLEEFLFKADDSSIAFWKVKWHLSPLVPDILTLLSLETVSQILHLLKRDGCKT